MNQKYQHYTNRGLTKRLHSFTSVLANTQVEEDASVEIKIEIKELTEELKWRKFHVPNRMTYSEQIHWIMKEVDFERIHKVMKFLDWQWVGMGSGVPSVNQLMETGEELLWEVSKDERGELIATYGTGGFEAKKRVDDGIPSLSLMFKLVGWNMDYEAVSDDWSNWSDEPYEGPKHD